jgi:formylglycine-generating enzyme required for sulfatase activity
MHQDVFLETARYTFEPRRATRCIWPHAHTATGINRAIKPCIVGVLVLGLVVPAALADPDGPKRYAFVVGANHQGKSAKVRFAEKDAKELGVVLQSLGFQVVWMNPDATPDLQPTDPGKILERLAEQASRCQPSDKLVVFFAGHGGVAKVIRNGKEDVEDVHGEAMYFCPSAAEESRPETLLRLSDVIRILEDCRAEQKLLLIDACRRDSPTAFTDDTKTLKARTSHSLTSANKSPEKDAAIPIPAVVNSNRSPRQGFIVFYSCASGKESYEDPGAPNLLSPDLHPQGEPKGQGFFTHALIRYLSLQAEKKHYPGNKLCVDNMIAYVGLATQRDAAAKGKDQVPSYEGTNSAMQLGVAGAGTNLLKLDFLPDFELRRISAGTFMMGSTEEDIQLLQTISSTSSGSVVKNEFPAHKVTLTRDFRIGRYEITVNQFRIFVEETKYVTDCEREENPAGWGYDSQQGKLIRDRRFHWRLYDDRNPCEGDEPVVNVSWKDAVAFCKWLTDKSRTDGYIGNNEEFRLPTEAEWEYCQRSGTTGPFGILRNPDHLRLYGNLGQTNPAALSKRRFFQLQDKPPTHENRFGLSDMVGNVWEWCQDSYGPYSSESAMDPVASQEGNSHVIRGGSWASKVLDCTSTRRESRSSGSDRIGFRVVLVSIAARSSL